MTVWIVSLEWNQAPSEVTGDTGIVGVFATEESAQKAAAAERLEREQHGSTVYEFSMLAGRHCVSCGEQNVQDDGTPHTCANPDGSDNVFCDYCGAECHANGGGDNDHDNWDIDVHCTEHEIQA